MQMKNLFYELYGEYTIKATALPFVLLHLECTDLEAYRVKLALDMR